MKQSPLAADLATLLGDLPDLMATRDLLRLLGISRKTLWTWMRRPDFPQPVQLSSKNFRWSRNAIRAMCQAGSLHPGSSIL